MTNKRVVIYGGGTYNPVACHLAIAAPAFGTTARKLYHLVHEKWNDKYPTIDVALRMTKMANHRSPIATSADLADDLRKTVADPLTKVIFFNCAVADFVGELHAPQLDESMSPNSQYVGKYQRTDSTTRRLQSSTSYNLRLDPAEKLVASIRKQRKDIFLVAFKTTCWGVVDGQSQANKDDLIARHKQSMYLAGLNLCKQASCNLVLVNNVHPSFRFNMIVTPEEAVYHETEDRDQVLKQLVDITWHRSHLTFTRSTVVAGDPVPWNDPRVPDNLRTVVNHCVAANAYKPFRDATVGHFACKLDDQTFLTSIRKSNFNKLDQTGLVLVKTDGPDTVIAYGAKPSVGGQSQRMVFRANSGYDCIVHFHCPLKDDHPDDIPVRSQREVECGSHECGMNTKNGLKPFTDGHSILQAVYLDQHGPNIVFSKESNPQFVIDFIERNFDLSRKTGGYQLN